MTALAVCQFFNLVCSASLAGLLPSLLPWAALLDYFSDKPFIDCLIILVTLIITQFYREKPIVVFIFLTASFTGKIATSQL